MIVFVVAFIAGIGVCSLVHVAWSYVSSRPRRFELSRDYFRPCTNCQMKGMSRIGMPMERPVVVPHDLSLPTVDE